MTRHGPAACRRASRIASWEGFRILTHVRCFLIHRDFCALSHSPMDCVIGSGGGSALNAKAEWAAKRGMNLETSSLKFDEPGEPLHIQQAAQIRAFRATWREAGHPRTPRVSVSRGSFALIDDRDRAYFGPAGEDEHKIGFLDETTRAVSAVHTLRSRTFSLSSLGKTMRSRKATSCC